MKKKPSRQEQLITDEIRMGFERSVEELAGIPVYENPLKVLTRHMMINNIRLISIKAQKECLRKRSK